EMLSRKILGPGLSSRDEFHRLCDDALSATLTPSYKVAPHLPVIARYAGLCNRENTKVCWWQKKHMRIEAEKKLFTTDDFSRMYQAGILNNDERVELVDGEI